MPPGDSRSNYHLVRMTAARLALALAGDAPDPRRASPEEAAALYHEELDGVTLDLALNGIGPDGHTASLFPNSPALEEQELRAVAAEAGLEPFVPRVTMTPKVFAETGVLVYLVVGEEKAAAVKAAFADEPSPATSGEPDPRADDDRDPRHRRGVAATSGVTPRPGRGGHKAAQPSAVAGDEAVGRAARAPHGAVGSEQVHALEACGLGETGQQRLGGRVVEGQEREPAEIEPVDEPRREAAEAAAAVVEQHRPAHGSSGDSSSAAMSRRPASAWSTSTVSATGTSSRYSSRVSNDSSTSSTAST